MKKIIPWFSLLITIFTSCIQDTNCINQVKEDLEYYFNDEFTYIDEIISIDPNFNFYRFSSKKLNNKLITTKIELDEKGKIYDKSANYVTIKFENEEKKLYQDIIDNYFDDYEIFINIDDRLEHFDFNYSKFSISYLNDLTDYIYSEDKSEKIIHTNIIIKPEDYEIDGEKEEILKRIKAIVAHLMENGIEINIRFCVLSESQFSEYANLTNQQIKSKTFLKNCTNVFSSLKGDTQSYKIIEESFLEQINE